MKWILFFITLFSTHPGYTTLKKEELHDVGLKIWQNECNGTIDGLISWNANEEFLSLGLGHFIWYPQKTPKKFEETFPTLIDFLIEKLKDSDRQIPSWIKSKKDFPWRTREEFFKARRSKKVNALRDFLANTLDLQMEFLLERFIKAEKEILPNLSEKQKLFIHHLKKTSQGTYALIDYVNFKGTGLSLSERYRGEGWGLLQVLQNIPEETSEEKLLEAFVISSKKVLSRRIKNAPPHRKEDRWLKGWNHRLETYKSPITMTVQAKN